MYFNKNSLYLFSQIGTLILNVQNFFEMNSTEIFNESFVEFETNILPLGTFVKVAGVLSYLLARFGNILGLGIIHYEKFGRDSQKRSFPDRIYTFNSLIGLLAFNLMDSIAIMRIFFGPLGNTPAIFICYLFSTCLIIPLGYAETILFRCLLIFFWKKCAMINDEILATFFILFNFMIGQIISAIRFYIGFDKLFHREYEFVSGQFSPKEEPR